MSTEPTAPALVDGSPLLPCPFCGSLNVDPSYSVGVVDGESLTWSAGCWDCEAVGPTSESPEAAVQSWSSAARNAAPPAPAALAEGEREPECEHFCAEQVIGDGPGATCMCGRRRWSPDDLAQQAFDKLSAYVAENATNGNRPSLDDLTRSAMLRLARDVAALPAPPRPTGAPPVAEESRQRHEEVHRALMQRLDGPLPLGSEHTLVARMQRDDLARRLCTFIERAMYAEAPTPDEVEDAKAAVARVGWRATWAERETERLPAPSLPMGESGEAAAAFMEEKAGEHDRWAEWYTTWPHYGDPTQHRAAAARYRLAAAALRASAPAHPADDLHARVTAFLTTLREAHADMEVIYTRGSCYRLYLLLRQVFEGATAYTNINHVITKIGERFYDITGEVTAEGYRPMGVDAHAQQAPRRADGVLHFPGKVLSDPGDLSPEDVARYCTPADARVDPPLPACRECGGDGLGCGVYLHAAGCPNV